jgi:regulator of protease activity HflC (stomatin/prohibitin superfamily)
MIRENERRLPSGIPMLLLLPLLTIASVVGIVVGIDGDQWVLFWTSLVALVVTSIYYNGFAVVNPNEGLLLQLFGDYRGTVKHPGLRFANPFYSKKRVSLRVRNFESGKLKVNDHVGNPIEIAAIVVWKVVDTAEAIFHVDDYVQFVRVQTESALRNLATQFPYDSYEDQAMSLRSHTAEIAEQLKTEIQGRLSQAGVEVMEARISHLAYAPEIAGAMLRRQQASAIVAARTRIVDGAVGMVEMALERLAAQRIVALDEERKAAMVSNLLVVLCGEREAQPVVNTGTLYQ